MTARLPRPLYRTRLGAAYVGDAKELLRCLPGGSVDLVVTSPPFALQRKKEYGNAGENAYVEWLLPFAAEVSRVLKRTGSFVLDLGGAYLSGRPARSLYNYRVLIRLCDEIGFRLAEEFFWWNPARLPSPIEWVNKRKIRAKDAVDTMWWLSKEDFPKADVTRVLSPYSDRMRRLLQDAGKYYSAAKRPSGHDITMKFGEDRGGAIPSNLLAIANTESNSHYLRLCKAVRARPHPARFPERLPDFFIRFLTEPGDLVLDIFAGSNATGAAAERLERRWIAFDTEMRYLATSAFRFLANATRIQAEEVYEQLTNGSMEVILPQCQGVLDLQHVEPES